MSNTGRVFDKSSLSALKGYYNNERTKKLAVNKKTDSLVLLDRNKINAWNWAIAKLGLGPLAGIKYSSKEKLTFFREYESELISLKMSSKTDPAFKGLCQEINRIALKRTMIEPYSKKEKQQSFEISQLFKSISDPLTFELTMDLKLSRFSAKKIKVSKITLYANSELTLGLVCDQIARQRLQLNEKIAEKTKEIAIDNHVDIKVTPMLSIWRVRLSYKSHPSDNVSIHLSNLNDKVQLQNGSYTLKGILYGKHEEGHFVRDIGKIIFRRTDEEPMDQIDDSEIIPNAKSDYAPLDLSVEAADY